MRLFEHPDFEQAILQAAEHFREQGLRPAIIEKDYYLTETLRVIATTVAATTTNDNSSINSNDNIVTNNIIIFKGGTSLSKGWNLIQRFSEDIDIFLDPQAFQPPLGKRAIDRELKKLRDAVAAHPALTFVEGESQTSGGFGRNDRFAYDQRFGGAGEVANRVLIEAGTASGREPTTVVELSSYLGQFLKSRGMSLGAEDEAPFSFPLLHFRRTFVEKMFAIHGKVELLKRDGQPLGPYARHYYDLFQLAAQSEVIAMLKSDEYAAIKEDYDSISRRHFDRSYFHPEGMSFAKSDALFPPVDLAARIGPAYEGQCRMLCYGPYPTWAEIQMRLLELRTVL
jgi:hypothetical protein